MKNVIDIKLLIKIPVQNKQGTMPTILIETRASILINKGINE